MTIFEGLLVPIFVFGTVPLAFQLLDMQEREQGSGEVAEKVCPRLNRFALFAYDVGMRWARDGSAR